MREVSRFELGSAAAGEMSPIDSTPPHGSTHMIRMDHATVPEIDRDVVDRLVKEDEIAGSEVPSVDMVRHPMLHPRVVRQRYVDVRPRPHREARAVEAVTVGPSELVRRADDGLRRRDDGIDVLSRSDCRARGGTQLRNEQSYREAAHTTNEDTSDQGAPYRDRGFPLLYALAVGSQARTGDVRPDVRDRLPFRLTELR
jgi:hypothetical protein